MFILIILMFKICENILFNYFKNNGIQLINIL
jgi:hypothetical protein